MFTPINEVAVLVATILAIAIGSLWYSPLMFGKEWMHSVGLSEEDVESSRDRMSKMFTLAILANIVALYILAQFIALIDMIEYSLSSVGVLLVLIHGAFLAQATIWEQKSLWYMLINVGYAAIVIIMGIAVIGHWPW